MASLAALFTTPGIRGVLQEMFNEFEIADVAAAVPDFVDLSEHLPRAEYTVVRCGRQARRTSTIAEFTATASSPSTMRCNRVCLSFPHTVDCGGISCAWSPNSRYFAVPDDMSVKVYDITTGRCMRFMRRCETKCCFSLFWCSDGKLFIALEADGFNMVSIWDVFAESRLAQIDDFDLSVNIRGNMFSPRDGARIAHGDGGGNIYVRETHGGQLQRMIAEAHAENITCIEWSPNAQSLVSSSKDHHVKIWDTTEWKCIASFPDVAVPCHFVFWSPDSTRILTVSDHHIGERDSSTGCAIKTFSKAVLSGIESASMSPDSQWVAVYSHKEPESVMVWKTTDPGYNIDNWCGDARGVLEMYWSPDSNWLLVLGENGVANVWRVSSFR